MNSLLEVSEVTKRNGQFSNLNLQTQSRKMKTNLKVQLFYSSTLKIWTGTPTYLHNIHITLVKILSKSLDVKSGRTSKMFGTKKIRFFLTWGFTPLSFSSRTSPHVSPFWDPSWIICCPTLIIERRVRLSFLHH